MTESEKFNAPENQPARGSRFPTAWLWRILRRGEPPRQPADTPAAPPAVPERTELDIHKERIAAMVRGFFDAVDGRVAKSIGYEGNIREALRASMVDDVDPHRSMFNPASIDPKLQRYFHNRATFSFRWSNRRGGPDDVYGINCGSGGLESLVEVATHNGFVVGSVHMRPDREAFHKVRFRRVFDDGRVRHVTTFSPHSTDPSKPSHPLFVGEGTVPMPRFYMTYDNIDPHGNVTLLDRQTVFDPSSNVTGRYSSADHTISSITSTPFPYTREADQLLLGRPGSQVRFPLQTNIYDELREIAETIRSIGPS